MTVAVRACDLRLRVTIQQRSTSLDTFGGQLATWSDLATVWASIEEASSKQLLLAQAVQTSVTHKITIRYQSQFADPKAMAARRVRLVKDNVTRLFNITGSHDDEERRRFLILDAEEGVNDG